VTSSGVSNSRGGPAARRTVSNRTPLDRTSKRAAPLVTRDAARLDVRIVAERCPARKDERGALNDELKAFLHPLSMD
jgi:hypothetical protein